MLYFDSIKHHIQFQYNCRGWGLGVGHYPPKSVQIHPTVPVCFLSCQILTKLCDFHYPYFRPDPKFYPQFQTLQVLHSSLKA